MCDYSVQAAQTAKATVGQKLVAKTFGSSSTGFAEKGKDPNTAICLLPGTEVSFTQNMIVGGLHCGNTARFTQMNQDQVCAHHDFFEFPNGQRLALGAVAIGVHAEVLQLPVDPATIKDIGERAKAEQDQKRVVYAG